MVETLLQGHQFTIKGLNACEGMSGPVCREFSYTFQRREGRPR